MSTRITSDVAEVPLGRRSIHGERSKSDVVRGSPEGRSLIGIRCDALGILPMTERPSSRTAATKTPSLPLP